MKPHLSWVRLRFFVGTPYGLCETRIDLGGTARVMADGDSNLLAIAVGPFLVVASVLEGLVSGLHSHLLTIA